MKCRRRVLEFVVSVLALAACATGPAVDDSSQERPLSVKDERVLEGPPCSVDNPSVCRGGTTCASLDLASGRRTLCVDPQKVCEQLQCKRGQCVILESYPIQIRCSG